MSETDPKLSIETKIELLQATVGTGFQNICARIDDLKASFAGLNDRVHKIELQVAADQVSLLRKDVDELEDKISALEVVTHTGAVKNRVVLAGVGFAASILGSVITYLLTK